MFSPHQGNANVRVNVFSHCSPADLMSVTFTGSLGLQTLLHRHMSAINVNASIQISIRELIYNMTTHNGFCYRCVVALVSFFLDMSAVTEIVTPAFLKIAKISNSLHSC